MVNENPNDFPLNLYQYAPFSKYAVFVEVVLESTLILKPAAANKSIF